VTLRGIGISAPGPLDPGTGTLIEPPNIGPGFRDVAFAAPIAAALGLPAMLDRDTNVAALAEGAFGAARGVRHFLYLTVSTGIGGAIMADGELFGGADGLAGEIGHMPVLLDGPPCGCGGAGHLEATSSGSGIARQARVLAASGLAPGIAAFAATLEIREIEAQDVARLEEAGDGHASAIMTGARRAFAAAMVGLVDIFNPELIVVGGGLAAAQGDRLLGPAREEVARVAFRVQRERVRIVPAALGDDVGLVGAHRLVALRRP
jgi:glucokinase